MKGTLEVHVVGRRVVRMSAAPPLAAKVISGGASRSEGRSGPGPGVELLIVGSAAGLLEGDRLSVSLCLDAGARVTVRTAAATLAHGCPGGGHTEMTVDADLGPGARLAWLPGPLVAHAGCRHRGAARLRLGPGAVAVWYETVALGRHGEACGQVDQRLDVELDGLPLLRDGWRAGDPATDPVVIAGARHVGSVALLGQPPPPIAGVMPLAGLGAVARALEGDAVSLDQRLAPVRRAFLDQLDCEELPNVA